MVIVNVYNKNTRRPNGGKSVENTYRLYLLSIHLCYIVHFIIQYINTYLNGKMILFYAIYLFYTFYAVLTL